MPRGGVVRGKSQVLLAMFRDRLELGEIVEMAMMKRVIVLELRNLRMCLEFHLNRLKLK